MLNNHYNSFLVKVDHHPDARATRCRCATTSSIRTPTTSSAAAAARRRRRAPRATTCTRDQAFVANAVSVLSPRLVNEAALPGRRGARSTSRRSYNEPSLEHLELHHHGEEHVRRRLLRRDADPVRRQPDVDAGRAPAEGRRRRQLSCATTRSLQPVLPGADRLSQRSRALSDASRRLSSGGRSSPAAPTYPGHQHPNWTSATSRRDVAGRHRVQTSITAHAGSSRRITWQAGVAADAHLRAALRLRALSVAISSREGSQQRGSRAGAPRTPTAREA